MHASRFRAAGKHDQQVGAERLELSGHVATQGVYYLLYDPNLEIQDIDVSSVQVFVDQGQYLNTAGLVSGRAYLDPRLPEAAIDTSAFMVRGSFKPLRFGADQEVDLLPPVFGTPLVRVIRLRTPVAGEKQVLAVTHRYRDVDPVTGVGTGPFIKVGGDTLIEDGQATIRMKLLRAPLTPLPGDTAPGRQDYFYTTAPLYPVRALELRNFYNLPGSRIDPKTFEMSIRRRDAQPAQTARIVGDASVPYLEMTGLDPGRCALLEMAIVLTDPELKGLILHENLHKANSNYYNV